MAPPKLYFTKSTCGAATYIAAKRAGIELTPFIIKFEDSRKHTVVSTKEELTSINPKGNVPTLKFEDGTMLNENTGTLYWVGETGNLLGATAMEKAQVVNLLGFLASELHVSFRRILVGKTEEEKSAAKEVLWRNFKLADNLLEGKEYLVGSGFTVADAYLYIILTWQVWIKLDFSELKNLSAYFQKIGKLDFVVEAQKEMEEIEEKQGSDE